WTAPRDVADKSALDAFNEPMTDTLAADARFALDRLSALGASGPFAGALDRLRVAIAGHSRGGKTVSRACTSHRRFGAAIVLDNLPPAAELRRGFAQPLLMLRVDDDSQPEHWARPGRTARWTAEDKAAARLLAGTSPGPAYDVTLTGMGHM